MYLNIEVTEGRDKRTFSELSYHANNPKNGARSLYSANDVKLSSGSTRKEEHVVTSSTRINMSTCIVDLNAPTIEVGFDGPSDSTSLQLLGSKTYSN